MNRFKTGALLLVTTASLSDLLQEQNILQIPRIHRDSTLSMICCCQMISEAIIGIGA
jgi:hypothetical protein